MVTKKTAYAVGGWLVLLGVVTAPIWIPKLFGEKPRKCKCGIQLKPNEIHPYCKCNYY